MDPNRPAGQGSSTVPANPGYPVPQPMAPEGLHPYAPQPQPPYQSAPTNSASIVNNVMVAAPMVVVVSRDNGPGLFIRGVWFLFIGWWLSWVAIGAAYLACLTIIGLPLGFYIFNRLPTILTLRPRNERSSVVTQDGATYVRGDTQKQLPMWVRALWFILVGWWLGALYMGLAWVLCVLLITLPIGLVMFNRVGAVMTLLRY